MIGLRRYWIGMLLGWVLLANAAGAEAPFPGAKSDWYGYDKYDFTCDGQACCVVTPKQAAAGKPWIWRARFFGHEPQTDIALLERGFHVVYIEVGALFGNPKAVAHWDAFHAYLTKEHGFAQKAALEGMSRGGLIIFNWASANPDKVACIYADAPVCDFKSWPGGKENGKGSPPDWRKCKRTYGLSEKEAMAYAHNPIDNLQPLADANIPLLHVCGGADVVVPVAENTQIIEERYRKLNGPIHVILKEGVGHHPHSLKDPTAIVNFVTKHTLPQKDYFQLRGGLDNARVRFEKEKAGRVAFIGGSITEMKGWRDLVCDNLKIRFPDTKFDFVDAGLSSTDSTLGPFRLNTHVLHRGRVDLLFVEFAVNDHHNQRNHTARVRGMEGIIRQAREANPAMDIIVQYFVEPDKMKVINAGKTVPEIHSHEHVMQYYNIPVIDLAHEVTERINAGEFTWDKFGGLHPGPFGHTVYAATIERLFDAAWAGKLSRKAKVQPYTLPERALDAHHYGRGRYVAIEEASLESGWYTMHSWNVDDGAGTRAQFTNVPTLTATEPGATLQLKFTGTAVGILVVAGPDVGKLAYSVDGGPFKERDQFTKWSEGLHIPWAYMLETELASGGHTLTLKTTDKKHRKSKGHAARIIQFLVN